MQEDAQQSSNGRQPQGTHVEITAFISMFNLRTEAVLAVVDAAHSSPKAQLLAQYLFAPLLEPWALQGKGTTISRCASARLTIVKKAIEHLNIFPEMLLDLFCLFLLHTPMSNLFTAKPSMLLELLQAFLTEPGSTRPLQPRRGPSKMNWLQVPSHPVLHVRCAFPLLDSPKCLLCLICEKCMCRTHAIFVEHWYRSCVGFLLWNGMLYYLRTGLVVHL